MKKRGRIETHEDAMKSFRESSDAEQRSIAADIEKRVMMSVALLGSFAFGFIFFGNAPSILSLQVLIGPSDGVNLAAKLLGGIGMVTMGLALFGRERSWWRPVMVAGSFALFFSWVLYFSIVEANIMTLLGTTPFLFFFTWSLSDSLRSSRTVRSMQKKLDERLSPEPTVAYQPIRRNGIFAGLFASLRRWLRADDLKG